MKKLYNRNKELEEYHVANHKVNLSAKRPQKVASSGDDSYEHENTEEDDGAVNPSKEY